MIVFVGEKWFNLTNDLRCEDVGIEAIRNVDPTSFGILIRILLVLGLTSSLSVIETLFYFLKTLDWKRSPLSLTTPYKLYSPLILVWVLSTWMSAFSLVLFGRQSMSLFFKMIHVFSELTHLCILLCIWQWHTLSVVTFTTACFVLASSITMDCNMISDMAGLGGLMDSINFLFLLCITSTSKYISFLKYAFGLHSIYVLLYFLNANYVGQITDDDQRWHSIIRTVSLLVNSLSIFYACKSVLLASREEEDKEEWMRKKEYLKLNGIPLYVKNKEERVSILECRHDSYYFVFMISLFSYMSINVKRGKVVFYVGPLPVYSTSNFTRSGKEGRETNVFLFNFLAWMVRSMIYLLLTEIIRAPLIPSIINCFGLPSLVSLLLLLPYRRR